MYFCGACFCGSALPYIPFLVDSDYKQTAEEAAIRNVMEVYSDGGMDGVT